MAKIITVLSLIAIILLAGMRFFHTISQQRLFVDEFLFTARSFYFELFKNRQFEDLRWYKLADVSDPTQPKIGPYVYGIALNLSGINNIQAHFDAIKYTTTQINGKDWWRQSLTLTDSYLKTNYGELVNIIMIGRVTSVIFSLSTLILVFWMCKHLVNTQLSIIATLLLINNPLFFAEGRRATTDSMQLFFFIANLFLVMLWMLCSNQQKSKKFFLYSFLIGITMALGSGVKTSGILTVLLFTFVSVFLLIKYIKNHLKPKEMIIGTCIALTTYISMFVWFHPFLYQDTFQRFEMMYVNRLDSYKAYWETYPGTAVATPLSSITTIYKRIFIPASPFGNFSNQYIPIDLILFGIGLFYLIIDYTQHSKNLNVIPSSGILLLWVVIVYVSLIFYLKNDWIRYYLPLVVTVTIIQSFGVGKSIIDIHTQLIAPHFKNIKK